MLRYVTLMVAGSLAMVGAAASAAEIKGTVFNLPKKGEGIKAITDNVVEIVVFAPKVNADGELERDRFGQLALGDPISSRTNPILSEITNGGFVIPVSVLPNQKERIVIVQFNRRGDVITQELNGAVVSDAKPLVVDVTVPTGVQMGPFNPFLQRDIVQPCP